MASLRQSVSLLRQVRSVAGRRNFASTSLLRDPPGDGPTPGNAGGEPVANSIQDRKQPPRKDNGPASAEVAEEVFEPIQALGEVENADTENSTLSGAPMQSSNSANASKRPTGSTTRPSATSSSSSSTHPPARPTQPMEDDPQGIYPPIRFDDTALATFPPLLHKAHRVFDNADRLVSPAHGRGRYGFQYTRWNNHFSGKEYFPEPEDKPEDNSTLHAVDESDSTEATAVLDRVSLTASEFARLHVHAINMRFVTQQTGKGKIQSFSQLIVVGNGNGLVGMATGKHLDAQQATQKALQQAVRAMQYIERFENRTIHRTLVGHFSATTVHLRPRPPGFGLRCPGAIHAIARSAGISDLSAKIFGSTHPINVTKAVLSALGSTSGPHGMGDGVGGSGRRIDKGQGAKTLEDLEIERGRRFRILSG